MEIDQADHETLARWAADPDDAATATAEEREWQFGHFPEHLRPLAFPDRGED